MHKAQPTPEFTDDAVSTCVVCHRDIKRVPGGHGPTWVHSDTGAVVDSHEPSYSAVREQLAEDSYLYY
jgi:hypothetical protein